MYRRTNAEIQLKKKVEICQYMPSIVSKEYAVLWISSVVMYLEIVCGIA